MIGQSFDRQVISILPLLLGIIGFLLYLLYDINSLIWQKRLPRSFFLIGTLLVGAATAIDLAAAIRSRAFAGLTDLLLLAAAALSFGALIYCLFFALPFDETYAEQENGRPVCEAGAYALCRHPGIPCFFAVYLFLGIAALPSPLLAHGMLFSFLNLAYAAFQDRVTFPRTFCNYETYRKRVPFLLPNRSSIRLARQTWPRAASKEDET